MPEKTLVATRRIIPLFVALILGAFLYTAVGAAPPRNVGLVYFRGESLDNAARLEWRTATESETAGFKIERASSASGPFNYLSDIGIIPARGSISSGATYEAVDETAVNGATYWYRLIEIESDNSENVLDTIELTISPEPTPEPVGGGNTSASSTPLPTSTSVPTSTPEPSATSRTVGATSASPTPTSNTTATPSATNTAAPAAQNTPSNIGTMPPSPTRFSFGQGTDTVEAAGPTTVAQVTDEPDSYPSPESSPTDEANTVDPYPGVEPMEEEPPETVPDQNYPGAGENDSDSGITSERAIGAEDNANPGDASEQRLQSTGVSRILLWAGFIVALIVFAGGVVFSILLSTRKRHNDLH